MQKGPYEHYTKEFREEAVKLVTESGLGVAEAAKRLSLPVSSLRNWVAACKNGKLEDIGKNRKQLSELELELSRLRKELAETRMERDILKKAAAYFAKESLPGTR